MRLREVKRLILTLGISAALGALSPDTALSQSGLNLDITPPPAEHAIQPPREASRRPLVLFDLDNRSSNAQPTSNPAPAKPAVSPAQPGSELPVASPAPEQERGSTETEIAIESPNAVSPYAVGPSTASPFAGQSPVRAHDNELGSLLQRLRQARESESAPSPHYVSLPQPPAETVAEPVRVPPPAVRGPVPLPNALENDTEEDLESQEPEGSKEKSSVGVNDEDIAPEEDKEAKDLDKPSKEEGLTPLQNRALSTKITAVSIAVNKLGTGVVPDSTPISDASVIGLPGGFDRGAVHQHVYWRPSAITHNPLYFEDAMLERHGHVRWGVAQPLVSGARFLATIPLLPYLKTLRPKHECVYATGHYRAGSCAPLLRDNIPYDKHAAVVETMSAAAFFWAAPL